MDEGEVNITGSTKYTILEEKVYRLLQFPHRTMYQILIFEILRPQLLQMIHEDLITLACTKPTIDYKLWHIGLE